MPLRCALASLALAASVGCGEIMNELDAANAMVGNGKPKPEKKAQPEAPEKKGIDWSVSRSINTGEVDESIVSCSLDGATQFMRRDDCLTRGGTPGRV
jgi:hypothetical protein